MSTIKRESERKQLLSDFKKAKGELFEMYHYSKHNKLNDEISNNGAKTTYGAAIDQAIDQLKQEHGHLMPETIDRFAELFAEVVNYKTIPMANDGHQHAEQTNLPYLRTYKQRFDNKFRPLIERAAKHAKAFIPAAF